MDATPSAAPSVLKTTLLVIVGVVFAGVWLTLAGVIGFLMLPASLMANDSGAHTGDQHMALIGGMYGGLVLAGLAGIPGGLAFFWRGWRKGLLCTFGLMLVLGILIQFFSIGSFFS